jgi:hypothetical protein
MFSLIHTIVIILGFWELIELILAQVVLLKLVRRSGDLCLLSSSAMATLELGAG